MSGNFYGYTKAKFLESPYNGVDFRDDPYDTTKKWSVYTPHGRSKIADIIERERIRDEEKSARLSQANASKFRNKLQRDLRASTANISNHHNHQHQTQGYEGEQTQQQMYGSMTGPHAASTGKVVTIVEPNKARIPSATYGGHHTQSRADDYDIYQETNTAHRDYPQRPFSSQVGLTRGMSADPHDGNMSGSSKRFKNLREKLYFDERTATIPKTTLKNDIIEKIIVEEGTITKNNQLMNSIFKLKTLNLLNVRNPKINRYSGIGKLSYITNDHHSRNTNPGYSRNTYGTFFAR